MVDRPKIDRAMWEGLKEHIIQDRKRKQEEQQEADAEERRRKEHESRKKQHAMTLEETKESIAKESQQLEVLKEKKHELFQQLKKVLHTEDNKRKERHDQHPAYVKENCFDMFVVHQQHPAQQQVAALPVHAQQQQQPPQQQQQVVFPTGLLHTGAPPRGPSSLYKMMTPQPQAPPPPPQHPPHPVHQQVTVKRPRSPSPPYQAPPAPYAFNTPASVVPVTQQTTKVAAVNNSAYISSQAGSFYHNPATQPAAQPPPPPPPPHHPAPQPATVVAAHHTPQHLHPAPQHHPAPGIHHHPAPAPAAQQPPHHLGHHPAPGQQQYIAAPVRDDKHAMSVYMHTAARGVHGLDHKKPVVGDGGGEKIYSAPPHTLHAGVLPVQPPGTVKPGGITSGFPVRPQVGPPTVQPPPHSSTAAHSYNNHSVTYTHARSFY